MAPGRCNGPAQIWVIRHSNITVMMTFHTSNRASK